MGYENLAISAAFRWEQPTACDLFYRSRPFRRNEVNHD